MGRDKATLEIDGTPMAVRVATALTAAGAHEVACIGPGVDGLAALAEDEPGSGPLGAIVAALRWAAPRPVVVAACDLVAPDPATFAALIGARSPAADAAVPVVGGRLQPLAASYAPTALGPLAAAYAAGERSITTALRGLRIVELTELDPASLRDADEPGDLPR